jgi:uncharacterized NAD-dependent epimerase/dehydratase family protein
MKAAITAEKTSVDGNAIVYCEGAFNTPNGKTAHGLVRGTKRYNIMSVIDSRYSGQDAGMVLDAKENGILIFDNISDAIESSVQAENRATHFVIGLAPDGGRLSDTARDDVKVAIQLGLNVDCGLHDFLTEDPQIYELAKKVGVTLRDIRKPPRVNDLHFFSGKIEDVKCLKIAVLGTDSAVGKRTTAWEIVNSFAAAGFSSELIGTGQTAWMQGAQYTIILDSLISDFMAGEIEHAVWKAWVEKKPEVLVIEGQGSLMNPAYPGGFEILAAGRPDIVILQHAPARLEYDGFPGYPIHSLEHQIKAIEIISGKPVVAVTINHEKINKNDIPAECEKIKNETGLPTYDVLVQSADDLVKDLLPFLGQKKS